MPQHHRLDLLADPLPHVTSISSGATQVADRLVALIGYNDARQISGPRLARQQKCVAPIGLDAPFRRISRDVRGRDYIAAQPFLLRYLTQPYPQGPASYTTNVLSLVHTCRHRLAHLRKRGIVVPMNCGASRSAFAIAIAMDSL